MVVKQVVCCLLTKATMLKMNWILAQDSKRPRKTFGHYSPEVSRSHPGNLAPLSVPGRYSIYGSNRPLYSHVDPQHDEYRRQTCKMAYASYGVLFPHRLSDWS